MKRLILLLLFAHPACGQVVQVAAGSSTLYGSTGAQATLYTPATTETVSAGMDGGRLVLGASSLFDFQGYETRLGDSQLFLTTGDAGVAVAIRGMNAARKGKHTRYSIFTGLVGQAYSTPFSYGERATQFGAGVQLEHDLGSLFQLESVAATTGGTRTLLQGAKFHFRDFRASGTVGYLQGQRFVVGSASYSSRHFGASAGQQSYVYQALHSNVTSEGVSTMLGAFDAHASAFQSHLATGQDVGAGARAWILAGHVEESYARTGKVFSASIQETMSRRFRISEYVTRSNGQTSINFGGDYVSNRVTLSVGYQQEFFPFLNQPFRKVLNATITLQLPHTTALTLGTLATPGGATRWTAYAGSYVQTPWTPAGAQPHSMGGKFIVSGSVVDNAGAPVEGAAIHVGKEIVYSDSEGNFFVRLKSAKPQPVQCVPAEFAAPGSWKIVDCPQQAVPGSPVLVKVSRP